MNKDCMKFNMNTSRPALVCLLIFALIFSMAHAEEQKEKPVLRGKIGTSSVMFCFAPNDSGRMPGGVVGYYYVLPAGNTQYLSLDQTGQYFEGHLGEKGATWQLDEVTDKKVDPSQ